MQSRSKKNHRKLLRPRGVSVVEFIGCLAALGGGVVLGSIYLGVDVQTLAAGVLEKADIEVPAILNRNVQAGETAPVIKVVEDNAPLAFPGDALAEDTSENTFADDESVVLSGSENASGALDPIELNDTEKLAATQACWFALNECLQEETSNRSKSIREAGSWQLFDYLLHRKEGHQKAVEAIEQLDHPGVDPRLEIYVRQVLTWHRSGAKLFDRAAQLLTDAPAGNLTGPFAQSWQSSATQHRMEEKLILNKHAAVANYLEHTKKLSVVTPTGE